MKTHYVKLVSPNECNAHSITESIKSVVDEMQLDLKKCVMFTSDGAEVMMGRNKGVQALLKVNRCC